MYDGPMPLETCEHGDLSRIETGACISLRTTSLNRVNTNILSSSYIVILVLEGVCMRDAEDCHHR